MIDAKDTVLAKARSGRSPEAVEAEAKYKLQRGQQMETLTQLVKTPEWKVFEQLVEDEELHKWERKTMDPQALETGVTMSEAVTGLDDQGRPVKQQMPAPIEGMSLAMQMCWRLGVSWGIRNTITFPQRAIQAYARMTEAQNRQRQLLTAGGQPRAPISGIDKNPIEGGA